MKLNILLPWICVLGLSAGLAAVYVSSSAKDTELTKLRTEAAQAEQRQTEFDGIQAQAKTQADQIAELRKDNQELLKLRSEVGQLRNEKLQLTRQVQTVQSQAQQAQSQAEQAMKTAAERATQLATAQSEQKLAEQGLRVRLGCINNLRQLDAAKQQWALEYNKTAGSLPTAQEIAPYLQGNIQPVCPAGGAYTLNAVGKVPTCSVAGHVLQ